MRLDRFIETRLAYSARTVRHLLAAGRVRVDGEAVADGRREIGKFCRIEADGRLLQARERLYLMLHKPRGCVSATRDAKHPTVLDLVDVPGKQELHLVGRLDFNTTGLLLLTNDGDWSARIMRPGSRMPKTYRVETRDPITPEYAARFAAGIHFRHENLTTLPARLCVLAERSAELTLHEGRYHQVKRMFGSFRNEVLALHRVSVGDIVLDPALPPGGWRHLGTAEVAGVHAAAIERPQADPGRTRRTVP